MSVSVPSTAGAAQPRDELVGVRSHDGLAVGHERCERSIEAIQTDRAVRDRVERLPASLVQDLLGQKPALKAPSLAGYLAVLVRQLPGP